MRLFAILVRCIVVGAICIVASAVYIVNAQAVAWQQRIIQANCPTDFVDQLYIPAFGADNALCSKWSGGFTHQTPLRSGGYIVTATGHCPGVDFKLRTVSRQGGAQVAVTCFDQAGGIVAGQGGTISAQLTTDEVSVVLLVIANVFALLAAISFGWRMSIRPPVGLME